MVMKIYTQAFKELMKKPFRLWGITLLSGLLGWLAYFLGGSVLLIGACVTILLQAALANIYLKSYIGGEQIHVVDLFETFRDWKTAKRVLCAITWGNLWKFLWFLIPIVGPIFAIIKGYEYSLIPYLVMDNPELKNTEYKEESTKMTNGYKGKMFLADILVYVAYFVIVLVLSLLARIPYVGVVFGVINVLFMICFFLLVPLFINIVHASFYQEIKNAPQGGQYPQNGQFYAPQGNPYYGQYPQYGQPMQQNGQYPQYGQPMQQNGQYPQYGQPAPQAPQVPQQPAPQAPQAPQQPAPQKPQDNQVHPQQ